ncbi:hypothetical protein BWQ96_01631 [Gracilariopsis chorda]|uniref:CHCH domain-containing protein n=1 Tax=Gracilariopsis chorda TaxID=448386 RepID=A0A2V3J2X8_9FLOR|nr:hypothetical protein BWQ96_01631 [Gracilariopsis chorda]|eukprot:PXF48462.1 hypothetical protein BWQ96_01631 [Gracilariopsis chorda]
MGAASRGPRLPKRRTIERLTKRGPECVMEMMALLSCFKESSFNEAKCAGQMRALHDCVSRKVPEAKNKRKSTVFYHLKRLYYMQRR